MTSLAPVSNAYDVALKPRALWAIIREELPGEKQSLNDPSSLPRIVRAIHAHGLLLESVRNEDANHAEKWKLAVDDWVARLLSLISDNMPDRCWTGICLLGVTCQECSSERFLSAYPVWFENILLRIQSATESQLIKVASCAALSDLFKRLSMFQSEKKDAVFYAGKLVLPLLKLLKENCSEALWERAIELLLILMSCFPASIHRYYETVEETITSKMLTGNFSVHLKEILANCLALLPRSKSDELSWVSTIHKVLLLVNGFLTNIFHGLEEESRLSEAFRLLVPPGEDAPTIIWGQKISDEASDKSLKRSKINCITGLILCCSFMIRHSFPVQVSIPVRSLLKLVERVLSVDGSVSEAALPFILASEQEFTIIELPTLHHSVLNLLAAVMDSLSSQFLPHVSYVVRLIREFMKRCQLPELRAKTYSFLKNLLIFTGIGTAIYISQDVVDNALRDLGFISNDEMRNEETNAQESLRSLGKRKSDASIVSVDSNPKMRRTRKNGAIVSQEDIQPAPEMTTSNYLEKTCVPLKTSALQALEALLTVVGSIRSDSWRPKVEKILVTIAMKCHKEGWNSEEKDINLLEFRLAALKALLASVVSPSIARPRHLACALDLFRRGKNEASSTISEFCTLALFSLEPLLHPRGVPFSPSFSATQEADHRIYDSEDDIYEPYNSKDSALLQNRAKSDNNLRSEKTIDDNPIEKTLSSPLEESQEPSFEGKACSSLQDASKITSERRSPPEDNGKDVNIRSEETSEPLDINEDPKEVNPPTDDFEISIRSKEEARTSEASKTAFDMNIDAKYEPEDDSSGDMMPGIVDVEPDSD